MNEQTNSAGQDRTSLLRSPLLMSRGRSAVCVIDVQEKLIPLVQSSDVVVWNISRLLRGAEILGIPVWGTEQYPRGLGPTIPSLKAVLPQVEEKTTFSCRECQDILSDFRERSLDQILLVGIETHVCVQQTALDFLSLGFDIWVAVDAVGSRFAIDHKTALHRMEQSGVTLTSTEATLFEWCEVSGTPEFKQISKLAKETPPGKSGA